MQQSNKRNSKRHKPKAFSGRSGLPSESTFSQGRPNPAHSNGHHSYGNESFHSGEMKTTAQMICDRFSKQGIPSKKVVGLKEHQLSGTFELNFKEDSNVSNMEVAPEIKTNLSFKEREELEKISKQLSELKLP